MRLISKLLIFPVISILAMGCAGIFHQPAILSQSENLAQQIDRLISIPELENAVVGIMVQSAESGEILYRHNANTLLMPASNEKLLTSAAALLNFGPDFQYETQIFTNGTIVDSVLKGDLIVVGSGDPTITYRFCEHADSCRVFQDWADSLKAKGIRKIEGDIIGVDDIFDDELIGYGWTVDNLPYSYSAQIGGLMFNENYVTVNIQADSAEGKVEFSVFPDLNYVHINPQLKIDAKETNIEFNRIFNTNEIEIWGTIKPGDHYSQRLSIHNPTLYFVRALKKELTQLGVEISGEVWDADEMKTKTFQPRKRYLFSHFSPPFKDVLKTLMKESQNLYAESLVKLMGSHFGEQGSFDEGRGILKQTLSWFGLEKEGYRFKDGSGLCRYNYVSPAYLVKVLRRMHFHPYGDIYFDCLPIAGVDGTIGYRMKGTVAEGKIFAKTGTISNVRCLSGYAISADGEMLIFSTMFNNFLCSVQVVMDVQDQFCMLLASFNKR